VDAQDLRVKVLVGVLVFPVRLLTPTAAENDGWMTPRETHSRPVKKPISAAFRLRLPRMPHPDRDSLPLVETGLSQWQAFPLQINESVTEPCLVAAGRRSLTPRVRLGWWLTVLPGVPTRPGSGPAAGRPPSPGRYLLAGGQPAHVIHRFVSTGGSTAP